MSKTAAEYIAEFRADPQYAQLKRVKNGVVEELTNEEREEEFARWADNMVDGDVVVQATSRRKADLSKQVTDLQPIYDKLLLGQNLSSADIAKVAREVLLWALPQMIAERDGL